jgi:hypothetical protein
MAGGRMTFAHNQEVRILTLDGRVSAEQYRIETEKADRRGLITLIESGTSRQIKVNQRRVLVNSTDGEVLVIQTGDKFRAVCPKCSHVVEVTPSDDIMECPTHGRHQLHWKKGERPMAETTAKPKKPTTAKAAAKPSPEKKPKAATRDIIAVDLDAIRKLKGCELWTKKVRFDHEKIDVQAHVLLSTDNNPRKLCFNTYDGTLGKKSEPLPIEEFCQDKSGDKKAWFPITDLEQTRNKLTKSGYEKK